MNARAMAETSAPGFLATREPGQQRQHLIVLEEFAVLSHRIYKCTNELKIERVGRRRTFSETGTQRESTEPSHAAYEHPLASIQVG